MMIMTSGGLKGEGVNAIKWLGQQIMVLHVYYENQNNIGVQCCSKCDQKYFMQKLPELTI